MNFKSLYNPESGIWFDSNWKKKYALRDIVLNLLLLERMFGYKKCMVFCKKNPKPWYYVGKAFLPKDPWV